MNSYQLMDKCKLCQKIATKERAIKSEDDRITRWYKEGGRTHSINKALETVNYLQGEISKLQVEVMEKRRSLR